MQDLLGYSGLLASLTYGFFICCFASTVHALYKYAWHSFYIDMNTSKYIQWPHKETTRFLSLSNLKSVSISPLKVLYANAVQLSNLNLMWLIKKVTNFHISICNEFEICQMWPLLQVIVLTFHFLVYFKKSVLHHNCDTSWYVFYFSEVLTN